MPDVGARTPETSPTSKRHLALTIELPSFYTADLDDLRSDGDFDSESDFLLNVMGEPGPVLVRVELTGEKGSEIVEVWGMVREAALVPQSPGYEPGGLTSEQIAEHGWKLRDPDA